MLKNNNVLVKSAIFTLFLLAATNAFASGGAGLPYEGWLQTIQDSLTGPVAVSITLVALVASGATLIFAGGEIQGFMKTLVYIVLVSSFILGGSQLVTSLFGGSSALLSI